MRGREVEVVDRRRDDAYDERGVDVTPIDRMLALKPAVRLRVFDRARSAAGALMRQITGR